LPKPRILIVDDEPANRKLLADLATREGYEALTASGGAEALALLTDDSVDLVLLDLMMPGLDGMAVLAELRQRRMLPALPVVVVTAHEDRKIRIDALKAGAVEFLEKPIDRVDVTCRLRTLVELKRLRDAAETDAATARAQLRAVVENAPDIVISVDREGIILFVNHVLPQYTREQVVGTSWLSYLQPEEREPVQAALDEVIATGRSSVFETRTKGPDGSFLTFEAHAGPIRLAGEIVGAVMIARDVTEKKRTEVHLQVSDRMASVGTLAAGVAHEINNPLAAVMANLEFAVRDAEILAQRHDDGEVGDMRDALRDARDSADRIRLIVRDLKLFSRAEEGDRVAPVDVRRVLESTLRMAWNEIRHRARLIKDYGTIPLVAANESRLGQVFLNLVVNAAQAIPEGDAEHNEIRIVSSIDRAGRVQVDIRDTGPGIPPEVLRRLFTPFFTTKPVGVGTGLGLSICQRIVTSLGGEIQVESQVGSGTTFRVLLPPAAPDAVEQHPAVAPPQRPSLRRGRILVVDDEPMIGQALRRTLAKEHEVTVVERAQDALDLLLSTGSDFDVIFCDLMMPQMTGMDLYEHLTRGGAAEPASRIIFLTGGAFTQRAREFLDQVPNLRIEKPFDTMHLRTLVNDRIR
jgi:PAS domain S-box-containing protein